MTAVVGTVAAAMALALAGTAVVVAETGEAFAVGLVDTTLLALAEDALESAVAGRLAPAAGLV